MPAINPHPRRYFLKRFNRSDLECRRSGEWIFDDESGEMKMGFIAVENESSEAMGDTRSERNKLFVENSLLTQQEASDDLEAERIESVIHELGHVLGLRHNFSGYRLDTAGRPDPYSVMGYNHLVPIKYYFDKVQGFLKEDLLSFQYLYADNLGNDAQQLRQTAARELASHSFQSDEVSDRAKDIGDFHYCQAVDFLMSSGHPDLIAFRKSHANASRF